MKPYRSNVGVVVFNSRGKVLVGERLHYPGIFQFPQGGIDNGEEPDEAAIRELYEETGLQPDRGPIGEIRDWLYYDFPEDVPERLKKYQGQKQKWYFFFWDGSPSELKLDLHEREFASIKWSDIDTVVEEIVFFKKPVYLRIAKEGKMIIESYLESL